MSETTSAVVEIPRDDEPLLPVLPRLEITGITFENNNPCKPQYPSLYKGPHNVRLEPAFQIAPGITRLQVDVRLADSAEVVLVDDPAHPGRPLCRVLDDPEYEPDISYTGADGKSCTVFWTSTGFNPATRVFRIYCRPKEGEHTDEQKVYGGLFLAFTLHEVGTMGRPIPPQDPGNVDRSKIFLTGADEAHRPLYDLHELTLATDLKVEVEAAYRVRRKERLTFRMIAHIEKAEWTPEPRFLQPLTKPDELQYELLDPKTFEFTWQDNGDGSLAKVTTFHAVPRLERGTEDKDLPPGWTRPDYEAALADIGADPTIIQPPKCDPFYGVCAPDGDSGA